MEQSGRLRVKNKAPAEIQITAEQLIREASDRGDPLFNMSKPKISEETEEQVQSRRKGFEDALRRNRNGIGTWLKYAVYEERRLELARARSIYERTLEVEPRMCWCG